MNSDLRKRILEGITVGSIVEHTMYDIPAYYAKCTCGWRCHKQPHEKQETAERCLERHNRTKHTKVP